MMVTKSERENFKIGHVGPGVVAVPSIYNLKERNIEKGESIRELYPKWHKSIRTFGVELITDNGC